VTATDEALVITEAGVYPDLPEDVYHSDPVPGGSLSASGAKKLLPPSCPARYRHDQLYGQPHKQAFEFGTAAHKVALGTGPRLVIVDAPDWRTKAAKEARDRARFEGHVPLLPAEHAEIQAMAAALRQHPIAGPLLDPAAGDAEQSLFWQDEQAGIWRRARLDFLPHATSGRMLITDYKTCDRADPASIRKAMGNYGYHMSAAQYTDGVRALGLDDDPAFLFVFQEKTPPYLVTVADLGDEDIQAGRDRMAAAAEIWRDCTTSGIWPGYSDYDITHITLPPWAAQPLGDLIS
jgi:hypothetical protein